MLKDLMTHKKKKHIENVSICWNFSNGVCPFEDLCWFKHEITSNENKRESDIKSTKCTICGKPYVIKKNLWCTGIINMKSILKSVSCFKKEIVLIMKSVVSHIKTKKRIYWTNNILVWLWTDWTACWTKNQNIWTKIFFLAQNPACLKCIVKDI